MEKQSSKSEKQEVVHFQTTWMKAKFWTYCGRKNISSKVKTTTEKSKVTCQRCLDLM